MCFVFELAYKLNNSVDGHNCRNSCHKIADQKKILCEIATFVWDATHNMGTTGFNA